MGMQPGPQNPVMMGNNPANQMNMPSSNQQMSNLIPGQPNQQPMMSGQPNPNNPGMPQPGIGMGGQVPGSQPPHGGQVPCFFFHILEILQYTTNNSSQSISRTHTQA